MAVLRCYLCEENPEEHRLFGRTGFEEGDNCPICYRPACRHHLTVVRWRWRESGQLGSAMVCKACKNSYAHRDWDVVARDWIT